MKKIILIALVAIAISCGTSGTKNEIGSALEGSIKIDGSSTVYPISEAVAEEFSAKFPKVRVTVGLSGTGGGFKKFCRGETDISDASRPIKESEINVCSEDQINYLGLEIAYDGLAVLINPKNTWVDHFTIAELKKIWEPAAQGTILRWNQVRPEWPDAELHLYGPGVASGTYDYFTEAIVGESGASRGDFTASEDDNVLVQGIASDEFGLGFFGLAYYEENQDKLKLVSVDGGNGPVFPTIETVSDGSYSPLSRPLFIYVNSKSIERAEVIEFTNFYMENTSALSKEVGYVPLPADLIQGQKDKLAKFLSENIK